MTQLLNRLRQGDMRTTGAADSVVSLIGNNQARFDEVFAGLTDPDPGLRMRVADVLEKASEQFPQLLQSHRAELLDAGASTQQEVQWHIAQMIPRLTALNANELHTVSAILERYFDRSTSKIVRVCSLQAMHDLARHYTSLVPSAKRMRAAALQSTSPSLVARARQLAPLR